jgi:hypothetical protein
VRSWARKNHGITDRAVSNSLTLGVYALCQGPDVEPVSRRRYRCSTPLKQDNWSGVTPITQLIAVYQEGERGLLPTLKRGTATNATLKEGASSYGHAAPARCAEARGEAVARGDKAPRRRVVCSRSWRSNACSTGVAGAGDVMVPRIATRKRR